MVHFLNDADVRRSLRLSTHQWARFKHYSGIEGLKAWPLEARANSLLWWAPDVRALGIAFFGQPESGPLPPLADGWRERLRAQELVCQTLFETLKTEAGKRELVERGRAFVQARCAVPIVLPRAGFQKFEWLWEPCFHAPRPEESAP